MTTSRTRSGCSPRCGRRRPVTRWTCRAGPGRGPSPGMRTAGRAGRPATGEGSAQDGLPRAGRLARCNGHVQPVSPLLNLDPPDHTRLRRPVQKAFTPGRVTALRPRVLQIHHDASRHLALLLFRRRSDATARCQGQSTCSGAYAFPLPITVICELLGIPVKDRTPSAHGRRWSSRRAQRGRPEPGHVPRGGHGDVRLLRAADRGQARVAGRRPAVRADPRPGRGRGGGGGGRGGVEGGGGGRGGEGRRGPSSWRMLFLLLVAGFETTVNLIASGTLALLTFPAAEARLRADPSLLPAAVEELLRYVNPLNHATERSHPVADSVGYTDPGRGAGSARDLVGQPGPGTVPGPGPAGAEPGRLRPPRLRPRHALLPWRAARPAGGRGRDRGAASPLA